MQMRHPHITLAQCQVTAIETFKRDGLLFLMRNLSPCFNDIDVLVCFVEDFYCEGHQFVNHCKDVYFGAQFILYFIVSNLKFQIQVTVNMLYLQGRSLDGINCAKSRHNMEVEITAAIAQFL